MQTKQELLDFIATFNKQPGEFTADEIYEIGVAHKSLPTNEKSWKDLADVLGYAGSPQALRQFIISKQRKDGTLPMRDAKEIEEDASEFEKLYKEKTQIRDTYNNYRLSLRNEARVESFKESLFKAIKELKPIAINKPREQIYTDRYTEAVLMVSDLHLGVDCNNFYNKFNLQVAKERLTKLTVDTIKYCRLHDVKRLNVVNLGDLIHGTIHSTARMQEEFRLVEQITNAAELMSNMLTTFVNAGFEVVYRSCTDNHSRAVPDKNDNIEEENFSRIIDWYIEARLGNSVKFAKDNIDASLGKFDLLNGKKVMFAHGHLENVNKCIDAFCGATREFIDYVLLSHYHNSREKAYNGSRLLINGSIVGTEQYALSKRLFGPAEQKLLIFDDDDFLDININLQ